MFVLICFFVAWAIKVKPSLIYFKWTKVKTPERAGKKRERERERERGGGHLIVVTFSALNPKGQCKHSAHTKRPTLILLI
jgi:hypothetical protein